MICEATLEESWIDVGFFPQSDWNKKLQNDFANFAAVSAKTFKVLPDFKVAIADLQMMLMDLRIWLEQVELGIRSQPSGDRLEIERKTILAIQEPIVATALQVLEKFEIVAQRVDPDARAIHMNYMKRQIHPLVLCAPFIHRTYFKPLGYAGDYEMVNMMVRDPYEGGSVFSKVLNRVFLSTPPVQAHRDRLVYLKQILTEEALSVSRKRKLIRIFNMGCGPAKEIQDFLQCDLGRHTEFTLVDFNDETLAYTHKVLSDIKERCNNPAQIRFVKKSVNQVIKDAVKLRNDPLKYDIVYCAGLFDYLSDPVCKKLLNLFYDLLAPGGLLVATNVEDSNPSKNWMEYVLDWHLVYRNSEQFRLLAPDSARLEQVAVRAVGKGVNIFLEVRKPENG